MAWVARVCRSRWGVHPGDAGRAGDAADDPGDEVPVQRAAVVGDQPLVRADVVEVRGGPGAEQPDEVGVQGHVPVVAELAQRDPQPVPGADLHDRVRVQVRQLPGPHAGAGQQLDDEPVTRVGAGPGRGHQPGRVAVVEELRQRLGLLGDVPGDDRIARRRVRPVPLDDSLEELADRAHPLPVRLPADHLASRPVPAGQPHLVVLDIITANIRDRGDLGLSDQPAGELAQRALGRGDAPRCQERAQLPQIPVDGQHDLRGRDLQARPLRGGDAAGPLAAVLRRPGGHGAHESAASWIASIWPAAAVSASISCDARRYCSASQSLARCR